MPTNKKTKIVATLGPACSTRAVLKDMIDAGVNVFRVNFSHADYADVKEKIDFNFYLQESIVSFSTSLSQSYKTFY